jgi:hypothetical protein
MRVKILGAAFALAGGAFMAAGSSPAQADDTDVTCSLPVAQVNSGQDGTAPRFTIECTGGSSAGNITYFGYEISKDPTVAALLERAFNDWIIVHPASPITVRSNLSDTGGAAFGCGAANCRILDYVN